MYYSRFLRRRNRRQDNRQRQLQKLEGWRAAKKRKHEQAIADGWTPEPKMERWFPFELGVRDKRTGEVAWRDLRSVRNASIALGLIIKNCS